MPPKKPNQEIPRSPEEFRKLVAEQGTDQAQGILARMEANNEEIRQSIEVVQMIKSPAWKLFWDKFVDYQPAQMAELLMNATGSVLEKGAAVEKVQGQMELMGSINADVEKWIHRSKMEPVDVNLYKRTLTSDKDSQ